MSADRSAQGTLRERRRQQTIREVEEAALGLVAERSFDEVSVDEIAAAAGVSTRTVFRYFATKEDVVLGSGRRAHDQFLLALESRPSRESPFDALRSALVESSTVPPDRVEMVRARARVVGAAPILLRRARGERVAQCEEVADVLWKRQLARSECGVVDVDPEDEVAIRTLAFALVSVARAEWDRWAERTEAVSPSVRIEAAIDIVAGGFHDLN